MHVLRSRPRLIAVGACVLLLLLAAVLLKDPPAADRALELARDPERFSTASEAAESLVDVGDAAKRAFTDCGEAPACDGWAQAAGYARVAESVVQRCTAAQREQLRRQVLAYLEAVARTPANQVPPDPDGTPRCS